MGDKVSLIPELSNFSPKIGGVDWPRWSSLWKIFVNFNCFRLTGVRGERRAQPFVRCGIGVGEDVAPPPCGENEFSAGEGSLFVGESEVHSMNALLIL